MNEALKYICDYAKRNRVSFKTRTDDNTVFLTIGDRTWTYDSGSYAEFVIGIAKELGA